MCDSSLPSTESLFGSDTSLFWLYRTGTEFILFIAQNTQLSVYKASTSFKLVLQRLQSWSIFTNLKYIK